MARKLFPEEIRSRASFFGDDLPVGMKLKALFSLKAFFTSP
jgi:hypothetical protein